MCNLKSNMHISCFIGQHLKKQQQQLKRLNKKQQRQYITKLILIFSYLISLLLHIISYNGCSGTQVTSIGLVGERKTQSERIWKNRDGTSSGSKSTNIYQQKHLLPAAANEQRRLQQPYQFQLQQQPLTWVNGENSRISGGNKTRLSHQPVVGVVPNQRLQEELRKPYSSAYNQHQQQEQQVFLNKHLEQHPGRLRQQHQWIPPNAGRVPPQPGRTAAAVTSPAKSVTSDIRITDTGALFACTGCTNLTSATTRSAWFSHLYRSLVSLQNPLLLGGDILVRTGAAGRPRAPPPQPALSLASAPRSNSYGGGGGRRLYAASKASRSALVDPVSLWPNGVIFYELDESVAHLTTLIWHVMQQFHMHTCIRFVERTSNEPDFLRIAALRGCSSYIGRIGGEQILSLGDGCEYRGTIAHELLHAVGFYHHQNRSDRDDFLEILWENVAKGKEDQFRKMAADENYLLNEFDYNSIMLYGPHTFGKTLDKITIKPKREGVILLELIEKRGLSVLDIDSVNKLYKCGGGGDGYDLTMDGTQQQQQQEQQQQTFAADTNR